MGEQKKLADAEQDRRNYTNYNSVSFEEIIDCQTHLIMEHRVIHCNRCLLHKSDVPADQNVMFYIANCRHVFCVSCRQSFPGCAICNDPNSQLIPINDQMNDMTRMVMTNPGSLLQAMEKSLAFRQMQMSFFTQAAEQKMKEMQNGLKIMANEAMELHKMASEMDQEARNIEAENSKLEMDVKKLEKDIKGMRSAIHSNFLLPRKSPTITRISPHMEPLSRR